MKRAYPYLIAIVVCVGAYFFWSAFLSGPAPDENTSMHQVERSAKTAVGAVQRQMAWETIDQSSNGFRVKMPSQPAATHTLATTETGSTEPVSMLIADTASGVSYAVAWDDNPPVERVNAKMPDKALDMARDGALDRTRTTLVSETSIRPLGFPGRQFTARNQGGGLLEARLILAGTRLYMLIVVSPSAAARNEQAAQGFFDSFALAASRRIPANLPAAAGE